MVKLQAIFLGAFLFAGSQAARILTSDPNPPPVCTTGNCGPSGPAPCCGTTGCGCTTGDC